MDELKSKKVKIVRVSLTPGRHQVAINELVELPFRTDSGAECNILPRHIVDELAAVGAPVRMATLTEPVTIVVAGGHELQCRERYNVDLLLGTAAGLVNVRQVDCLVLNGAEDEFLLGDDTLKPLGINVDRMIEQLTAAGPAADDTDEIMAKPKLGRDDDAEVQMLLEEMVVNAERDGFPTHLIAALRQSIFEYRDVWRIQLGANGPARVEPLRIQLCEDHAPFR